MSQTIIGLNDAKAVKRWATFLWVDTAKTGYFTRKFMSQATEATAPVQILPNLENEAGEQITYDLSMQLTNPPIEGDNIQEGTEEALSFYTDNVYIDQMRGGVSTGGRMTRKRTLHDLRSIARKRQSEWWARVFDELFFMYASGARGINADYIFPLTFTGRANNTITAPDTDHLMYGGAATSKATLTTAHKADLALLDRLKTRAITVGGGTGDIVQLQPIMIDGEEHFVIILHPFQEHDIRTDTNTGQWLDIQKSAAGAEGRNNPLFKGSLGMYNNIVLHCHKNILRFSDYGSGSDVYAGRALFMGRQALVCAFGSPGTGLRFNWHEESRDNGNQVVISTSTICGLKKSRFNSYDFGLIAADTAAADPT